jgi:hypothetical protein
LGNLPSPLFGKEGKRRQVDGAGLTGANVAAGLTEVELKAVKQ